MNIGSVRRLLLSLLLLALASPAWAEPALRFASPDGVARVPFIFENNHIIVRLTLADGKSGDFIVDTGADYTLLNASFARAAGITSSGESSIGDASGSVSMSQAPDQVLRMPGLEVEDSSVVVMNLDHLQPALGRRIDGVLGNDILGECAVRIDYEAGVITFYRPGAYTPPAQAAVLPLSGKASTRGVFVPVTLTLPGRTPEPLLFVIDSGASYSSLNSPYVDSSGALQAMGKTLSRPGYGASKTRIDFPVGRASGLALGPYLLAGPVLGLYRGKDGVFASSDFQGVLGMDVLQRFTATLDYPDKKLVLEPNASLKTPFRVDASGLVLIAQGEDFHSFQVLAVTPDSPATDVGMKEGDVIEQVDGAPASGMRLADLKQKLSQDGQTVRLTVRRGDDRLQLTLKLRKLL